MNLTNYNGQVQANKRQLSSLELVQKTAWTAEFKIKITKTMMLAYYNAFILVGIFIFFILNNYEKSN